MTEPTRRRSVIVMRGLNVFYSLGNSLGGPSRISLNIHFVHGGIRTVEDWIYDKYPLRMDTP